MWPGVVVAAALARRRRPATRCPRRCTRCAPSTRPLLERRYDNVAARLRDLEQIEAMASGARDRAQFLTDLALDPPS